ncbi:serine/threonine-protein kinase [Streptomyces millisiae]|uniref:Serine/threonine-protein kinase n=1 Tax=Streptomyces millisiae TaxID=3075542 RepID=A0ABU2LU43_9ACTN|nr:serine/threonine-protein kinase [Streptomyces sp. DSM 44918]MDT0321111.1 serine/threonine-protein kinase [Streptomyces sp. DSM 44918]
MEALRAQDPAAIGEFTLLARLGAGGMGRVYLGRSPGGTRAAVKVIREDIADEPGALARFRREVATVRAVRSPFTANLIGASLDAPPYWLATEYVPGPTLLRALRDGPLPPELCTGLLAALAEGLAAVHAQGVVHRDLKPHNVILAPNGPRLIDFGIARAADQTQLTRTGQAPGTPGYTAPEVLLGAEAGPAADVFALGATLAAAATGRPPYGGGEWPAVSYRVVHGEVDVAGVHPGLAALIRACVARAPADRPTPADVVRRCAVSRALPDLPAYQALQALAEPAPYDLPTATAAGLAPARPPRGRRARIATAALAVTAVIAATTVWLGTRDDGEAARDDTTAGPTEAGDGQETTASGVQGGEGADDDAAATGDPLDFGPEFHTTDRWDPAIDSCRQPPEERVEQWQWSVDTETVPGEAEIGWRLKLDLGEVSAPYPVAAAVRPPAPEEGNAGIGTFHVSEVFDLFEGGAEEWRYVTYPDDFPGAPPLGDVSGDWTVVWLHVTSDEDAASVACDGFSTP